VLPRDCRVRHHGAVTEKLHAPAPLPPDPEQYDAVRNEHARRRGLKQAYIAGGDDPDLHATLRRERYYLRILIVMVVLIVVIGFGLGIIEALIVAPPA
jgi:hypothetical protein